MFKKFTTPKSFKYQPEKLKFYSSQSNRKNVNSGIKNEFAIKKKLNIIEFYSKTDYEKLLVPELFVKQKMEWLKLISGSVTENK